MVSSEIPKGNSIDPWLVIDIVLLLNLNKLKEHQSKLPTIRKQLFQAAVTPFCVQFSLIKLRISSPLKCFYFYGSKYYSFI